MSNATAPLSTGSLAVERAIATLKEGIERAVAAQAQVSDKAIKATRDVVAFNHESLAATNQASRILALGLEDLLRQMATSGQDAIAQTLTGLRALANAPSIKERLDLQSDLIRSSTLRTVSDASRFARAGVDLADKASAPLIARATLAAETLSTMKL